MAEVILDGVRCVSIPDYPNYLISENGDVYSRLMRGNPARESVPPWKMKPTKTHHGYWSVALGGRYGKRLLVHRLVLLAFVGSPPEGCEACHNNGDRADASLANLRWDTIVNNHRDKVIHGTLMKGEDVPSAVLNSEIVGRIKEHLADGIEGKQIAEAFGVSEQKVSAIRRGKLWKHVSAHLNDRMEYRPHWPHGASVSELSRQAGIKRCTVHRRLKLGWSLERATTEPVRGST